MVSCLKLLQNTVVKNAYQSLAAVQEVLAAGCPILLTDGTVTHKVIQVEISNWGPMRDTFDVQTVDSNENTSWMQIALTWPWDELTEYGVTTLDGTLYIAPDWWIGT